MDDNKLKITIDAFLDKKEIELHRRYCVLKSMVEDYWEQIITDEDEMDDDIDLVDDTSAEDEEDHTEDEPEDDIEENPTEDEPEDMEAFIKKKSIPVKKKLKVNKEAKK